MLFVWDNHAREIEISLVVEHSRPFTATLLLLLPPDSYTGARKATQYWYAPLFPGRSELRQTRVYIRRTLDGILRLRFV